MPVSSTYPLLDIPETDLYSFIFRRKNRPFSDDQVMYIDSDNPTRKYTYADCKRLSQQLGAALTHHYSIKAGDVVAVLSPNDIDFPVVTFAALSLGAVVSTANPGYTPTEFTHQLKDSTSKLVFAHYAALTTAKTSCEALNIPFSNIILIGATHDPSGQIKHWTDLFPVPTSQSTPTPPKITSKSSLAFLVYSSGTTGRPKGVMLTHHNLISNVLQITACEAGKLSHNGHKRTPGIPDAPQPEGDTVLSTLPFFHIYGLTSLVITPLHNGIRTVILPKFEIERFCKLVQEYRITYIYVVPPMAILLAKHPCVDDYDLSSVRMTNSGAAPLVREVQEAVFKRCGIRIKQGYGLSETSPTTHEQRFEDWDKKVGTVGRLQPNMQAKFCEVGSEDGVDGKSAKEVKAGETGELYLKGPNIFKGYWQNEAATRECLSKDGWFRTGDIGHVDEEGDFFITDRVKELIKYKGFQVAPAELEGYLIDNEMVDDVVVVGVNSKLLGTEVPRAYVVRRGGMGAVWGGDEEKIRKWLDGRVIGYKKLRGGVRFVESVPKNASGKLLRRMIREKAQKEFTEEEEEEEEKKKGGEVKAKL